jgi:ribose transport system substrate-binding protein
MKKMKYILPAILMAIVLAATGCGDKKAAAPSASETSETSDASETSETSEASVTSEDQSSPAEWVIGFSNYSVVNTWRVQFEEEFRYMAEQYKEEGKIKDYIMTNAQGDVTKQIADVKDLITKEVDAIVISAASPDALAPVCEEAVDKGIAVVAVDQIVASDKLSATIAFPYSEVTKMTTQWMLDELDGKGKIVVIGGTAGSSGSLIAEETRADMLKEYPDMEILTTIYCNWDYATTKKAMQDVVAAYPEIDGILAGGGAMAQAAIEVLANDEKHSVAIPITGEANNGYLRTWKEYMEQGYIGMGLEDSTQQGAMGLETAVAILNGNPPANKDIIIDVPMVTQENFDEWYREDLNDQYWPKSILPEEKLQEMYGV